MPDGEHTTGFHALLGAAMNLSAEVDDLQTRDPAGAILIARLLHKSAARVLEGEAGQAGGLAPTPGIPASFPGRPPLTSDAPDPAAAATPTTIRKDEPHARRLYNGRGMLAFVAELIILQWLSLNSASKSTKEGLHARLSAFCDIGTKGSFATRLSGMRDAGWLEWPKGLHEQAIKLAAPGRGRLVELSSPGDRGLDEDQYDCLVRYAPMLQLQVRRL